MKRVVLAVSALGLAVICGAADKSDLAPAFKNTVISTYPDGRQAKLWLAPDGTYKAQGRKGDASTGVWKIKGDQMCMKQKSPKTLPLS
jgi:hypothetical protein